MFDVDHPRFLPPGDMPARFAEACRAGEQVVPTDRVTFVRATQPLSR